VISSFNDCIAEDSLDAAYRASAIRDRAEILVTFPEIG